MSYAIISLSGKQYKVTEGQEFTVQRLSAYEGETIDITDVLLVNDGKKVKVGQPHVKKSQVSLEVLSHQRGPKLRVATYKSKSRYRRVKGHRDATTTIKVSKIVS
jgi:large subunit ribosomal protein L21